MKISITELQDAIDAVEYRQHYRDSIRMALIRELRARGYISDIFEESISDQISEIAARRAGLQHLVEIRDEVQSNTDTYQAIGDKNHKEGNHDATMQAWAIVEGLKIALNIIDARIKGIE